MMRIASTSIEAFATRTSMNIPDRIAIEASVRQLRHEESSRLLDVATTKIGVWLRERHESALRQPKRIERMRSANATPA